MIEYLAAIILSAFLYRVPRGTGLPKSWRKVSKAHEAIWAAGTAVLLAWTTGNSWALVTAPLLMAGEAMRWSRWWPNHVTKETGIANFEAHHWRSMVKLSLRGCLLLNPFMGPIYYGAYVMQSRIPAASWAFVPSRGWTEVSEYASGMITASAWSLVWYFIGRGL